MNETEDLNAEQTGPSRNNARLCILIALVLVVVIVVTGFFLITRGLPALMGDQEPTAVAEARPTASLAPTFTPRATTKPTSTSLPTSSPTPAPPVMLDTDQPAFEFLSAGARPGADWTGFFGQVLDSTQNPLEGVPLIVWYPDGTAASPVVKTDIDGNYEIRLANAPLAGTWMLQVLSDDMQPASKPFTVNTDENTQSGFQQIQVIWQQVP